jgi:hypothetical protein
MDSFFSVQIISLVVMMENVFLMEADVTNSSIVKIQVMKMSVTWYIRNDNWYNYKVEPNFLPNL